MEKEKEEFKPFVPAEKQMKEFSITAVIVGNDGVSVNSGGGCINGDSARFAAPQFYLRK